MSAKKTHDQFLLEMLSINPSIQFLGEYEAAAKPINCSCAKCEYVWTSIPNRLLSGAGCPKCGGIVNPTLEEFQEELKSIGKPFKVSGEFKSSKDVLHVTCVNCGFEWYSLSGVLRRERTGCKNCRSMGVKTPKELSKYEKIKDKFLTCLKDKNFTLVGEFINYSTRVDIICNTCNRGWNANPSNVISNGCARCSMKEPLSLEVLQKELDEASRPIIVEGPYVSAHNKVGCTCVACGNKWRSTPNNLRQGRGCPSCARTGFDPNKPGMLYYLRIQDDNNTYWKIGITNLSLKQRFRPKDREKITVLNTIYFQHGLTAYTCEQNILKLYKDYKVGNIDILHAGNTELFRKDVLQMDHLREMTDGFT